jgi:hypothetical protein
MEVLVEQWRNWMGKQGRDLGIEEVNEMEDGWEGGKTKNTYFVDLPLTVIK